jgi:AraC-like DNA-binding protein
MDLDVDVLASVLASLRFSGAAFCRADLGAPWGVGYPAMEWPLLHVVDRGACWLKVDGNPVPMALAGGDLVLFPRGCRHQFSDSPSSPIHKLDSVLLQPHGRCPRIQRGGKGALTSLICGGLSFDRGAPNPVVQALPELVLVRSEQARTVPGLEPLVRSFAAEAGSDRPGAELVAGRLAEILFVQVVRAWADGLPADGSSGWIRALQDPQISRAIGAIHQAPGARWSVADLAKEAAMSRSSFAARFTELLGEPPLRYVTRWRMAMAARALREGAQSTKEIAERFGYESQAAFTKAFRREVGTTPGGIKHDTARPRSGAAVSS